MTATPSKRHHAPDAGFTLLEILVALVVIGLILASLGQALHFGLGGWRVQTRVLAGSAAIEPVDRALRRLIAQLDPNGSQADPPLSGTPATLVFASRLPDSLAAGTSARAAMRLGMSAPGTLTLAWQPAPVATRLAQVATTSHGLLSGLRRVEFSYYGATPDGPPGWHGEWHDARPPVLVRIRLIFPPADPRHWPDIVEAPRTAALPR